MYPISYFYALLVQGQGSDSAILALGQGLLYNEYFRRTINLSNYICNVLKCTIGYYSVLYGNIVYYSVL